MVFVHYNSEDIITEQITSLADVLVATELVEDTYNTLDEVWKTDEVDVPYPQARMAHLYVHAVLCYSVCDVLLLSQVSLHRPCAGSVRAPPHARSDSVGRPLCLGVCVCVSVCQQQQQQQQQPHSRATGQGEPSDLRWVAATVADVRACILLVWD
jgi:hypothetical protein